MYHKPTLPEARIDNYYPPCGCKWFAATHRGAPKRSTRSSFERGGIRTVVAKASSKPVPLQRNVIYLDWSILTCLIEFRV